MSIQLAEPDMNDLSEMAHALRNADPVIVRQIEKMLDDPATLDKIANSHSSLLVRLLARRVQGALIAFVTEQRANRNDPPL